MTSISIPRVKTYYYAGAPWCPGTNLPDNVTGDCAHRHRSPEAAEECIRRKNRAIKDHYGRTAYCDRVVMVVEPGERPEVWAY